MLLIDALVDWLVSLGGDAFLRHIRHSPDERALRKAMALAIEGVIAQALPSSRDALERALRDCFSTPPRLSVGLDELPLERRLRTVVAAQMEPLAEIVEEDLHGKSFDEVAGVRPEWLAEQVADAFISALRQVVATSNLAELVHRFDADELNARLSFIASKVAADSSCEPIATMFTLPRDIDSFTGRDKELETLLQAVIRDDAGSVVSIEGMPGVGKTAFAIHAAHRLATIFPDGQLFLPLHAYTPGHQVVHPADALSVLLRATGVDGRQIPVTIDAMAAMWRAQLRGKRVLLVLDDAANHEQIRPLIPSADGCMVLITSRRHLIALDDAFTLPLNTMIPNEACALFNRIAARSVIPGEADEVARITHLCGYLPLAIGILASLLRHHPSWSAADLLDDLTSAHTRVTAVHAENVSVASAFDASFEGLPGAEQHFFRLLGVHVGPEIDSYAAAAITNSRVSQVRSRLDMLYDAHLLDEPVRGRYRFHDLIREYARTLAAVSDTAERKAAFDRLSDYYLNVAFIATKLLSRRAFRRSFETSHHPTDIPELSNPANATAWLECELTNLQMCVKTALELDHPLGAVHLADCIAEFLITNGHWARALTIHKTAVEAARNLSDELELAIALNNLGSVQRLVETYATAEKSLTEALDIFRHIKDRYGESNTLNNLGIVQRFLGDHAGARASHEQALNLFRQLDDRLGEAEALENLGVVQRLTANYSSAAESLSQAQVIFHALGDRLGEADTLHNLAAVQRLIGSYQAATASHERALTIYRDLHYTYGQAYGLTEFSIVQRIVGEPEASARCLLEALELFRSLGDRLGEADAINGLGYTCQLSGDYKLAIVHHEQAFKIYQEIDYKYGQAYALRSLGIAFQEVGQYETATSFLSQAVDLFQTFEDLHAEAGTRNALGAVYRLSGSYQDALTSHQRALRIAKDIGSPLEEARALEGIGSCLALNEEKHDALDILRRAVTLYQQLHLADVERVRAMISAVQK